MSVFYIPLIFLKYALVHINISININQCIFYYFLFLIMLITLANKVLQNNILFSICNLEMLNFYKTSTTLSSFQESSDKMLPDFYYSSDFPISFHLSAESTGCNNLPSVGHV